MEASIDRLGRIVVPGGPPARIIDEDGVPVVAGSTVIDDSDVFALVDSDRR